MCQRKRFGVVLLLVAGLVSLLSRPVPAQNVLADWGAPGSPRAATGSQPQIIASTSTTPPPVVAGDRLPPPDDGLVSPKPKETVKEKPILPTPPVLSLPGVQPVGFVAETAKEPVPQAALPTAKIPQPVEPLGSSGKWENAAGLAIVVVGPADTVPGQAVACQIQVKNTGSHMLAEVGIELPVPPGARIIPTEPEAELQGERLVWKLGNMDARAERVLRLELQSTRAGEIHLCPRATFGPANGLRTSVVRPAFSLAVTGPEGATPGEKIVFQVKVGNHTNAPITSLNLRCTLSEGLIHPEGKEITTDLPDSLMPGQVRSLQLEAQVRSSGRHQINVSATAIGGHRSQASWSVPVSEASLVLTQRGPRQANIGEVLSYRLEISNPGRTAVGPVRLSQVLPEGMAFNSAGSSGSFEVATQSVVWTIPSVQPGELQAVAFTVQGRKPGDWAMPVSAGATGSIEARATHAVRIDATPASSLTVKVQDDRLAINAETVCEARLFNQGTTSMRDARLIVQLPEGLDLVSVEGPTRWQQRGRQVIFEPLPELGPRVDAIYQLRVRAVAGTDLPIQAELNAAGMEKPQQAFRSIQITTMAGGR